MSPRPRSLRPAPLRDLPIFWKLLLPFLVLLLVVGSAGAYIIVRDLTSKSAAALSDQLTLRVIDARSQIHVSELDLLESVNYASNLQGMADAITNRRSSSVSALLQSVLALKTDIDIVAATNDRAVSVAEFVRSGPGETPSAGSATDWSAFATVRRALEQGGAAKTAGFVRLADRTFMIMVAPICRQAQPCTPLGFTIVGLDAARAVQQVATAKRELVRGNEDVSLYDQDGLALTSTAKAAPPPVKLSGATQIAQRRTRIAGLDVASAYTGFTLAGQPAGTIAVTIPAKTPFGSVGPAALRLVGLVILAMTAAIALGAAVSRLVLRQLRTLVETSRELGEGRLSARAPVMSEDEHGELAAALNRMAEQLQASHDTLELKVAQRTEEIQRLLRDRTEFFAGLSHELRTPLAIILTQAEMLTTKGDRSARGEAEETIRASASQLLELVNDILDLARAEAGTVEVELEPVSLPGLFGELTTMLVRLGAASGIDLKVDLPARLPVVTADPARLREVVVNLVDNAIKYTPSGGRIEISAAEEDGDVRVSVADTGVGIPDEVGNRVFEPFYRVAGTSAQRDQASSGLGLALSRRWVEAQGGTISWAPNPNGGTVFDFTLPVDRTGLETGPRRETDQRDARRTPGSSRTNGSKRLGRKSNSARG